MIEAELPDGTILEFPDNTPIEVMQRAAKRQLGLLGNQPRQANYGAAINRGIASSLGFPVDLASMGVNALSQMVADRDLVSPQNSFGGSESIARGMQSLGFDVMGSQEQPVDMLERGAKILGETAGGIFLGGGLAKTAAKGSGAVSQYARDALSLMAQKPKTVAASEIGGLIGGTIGEEIGAQYDSPVAETIGRIGGGIAGSMGGIAGAASKLTGAAGEKIKGAKAQSVKSAQERAMSVVPDIDTAKGLLKRQTIADMTPMQKIGTDEALALEKAVAMQKPNMRIAYEEALARNTSALKRKLLEAGGDVSAPRNYLESRKSALLDAVDNRVRNAQEFAEKKLANVLPRIRESQASQIVASELDKAYKDALSVESALWRQVPDVNVDTNATKTAMDDIIASAPLAQREDIPALASRLFADNGQLIGQQPIRELQGFRSKMLEEARKASAEGQNNKARIARLLADAALTDMGAQADNVVDGAGRAIRTALDYSRKVATTFETGTVGKLLGSDRQGVARVADELALRSTVGGGGVRGDVGLDKLIAAADTPEMRGAASNFLLQNFQNTAVRDGQLNPVQARRFLQQNVDILDRFPEVRQNIEQAISAMEKAGRAEVRSGALQKSLTQPSKSATAGFLAAPVDYEIRRIYSNPEQARKVASLVRNNPEALQGLRASALNEMMARATGREIDASGAPIISGTEMLDDMLDERTRKSLEAILGKHGLKRAERIAMELRTLEKARTIAPAKQITKPRGDTLLSNLGGYLALHASPMVAPSGPGSLRFASMASKMGAKAVESLNPDQSSQIIAAAINDKELFEALLTNVSDPIKAEKAYAKIYGWLLSNMPSLVESE
jgi:hypothetical protein